jgi:hypothetical protein
MSHEITKIDAQQGLSQAWHGLTQIKPDLSLNNCWLNDWEIVKEPLFLDTNRKTEYSILTASDNPNIQIGVPFADSYVPIPNEAFIDCIRNATMGIDGLKLVSVGSIMGRNRVFVSFEIGKANFTYGKRDFECALNFGNAHDKGTPFFANTSNVVQVCKNTYNMNLHHKSKNVNVRVRHTKNSQIKLDNMEEIIAGALGAQAEFKAIFGSLTEIKTNPKEATSVFAGFIGKGEELSTRAMSTVTRLTSLFINGAGNDGENRSDIFSSITDYYSHESSGGENRMKQWVSSEFGSGAAKKREFLETITTDYDNLVKMGEKSLSLSN